jgi:hypothetical protein
MQTFLTGLTTYATPPDPRTDWIACVDALDRRRAHKQAVEAQQMVAALLSGTARYPGRHAVTLSWSGHVPALAWYGLVFATLAGVGKSAKFLHRHADPDAPLPAWFAMPHVLGTYVESQRGRLVDVAAGVDPRPCLYPTMLLCPHQPGDLVWFDRRGSRDVGRVVAIRPAALEIRIRHDRGACWRRIATVAAATA